MRATRLIRWALAVTLAAGALAAGAAAQTMTFRPVPAESVASATEAAKADARRMREEARREIDAAKVRLREQIKTTTSDGGVHIQIGDGLVSTDSLDAALDPAVPKPPNPRSSRSISGPRIPARTACCA